MTSPPTKDLSEDRDWLDAYRRGEDAALERVFRVYAPYVVTVLRRGATTRGGAHVPGVGSSEDLEDVLHDVFLAALTEPTRARYDGLRPYAPFVGQIARFKLVDHLRRHRRVPVSWAELRDDVTPMWTPQMPLPDTQLEAKEDRRVALAFKATLTPQERAFVEVRFEQGESQARAASVLGSTRQRMRTLESRVRARFQAFVGSAKREASKKM